MVVGPGGGIPMPVDMSDENTAPADTPEPTEPVRPAGEHAAAEPAAALPGPEEHAVIPEHRPEPAAPPQVAPEPTAAEAQATAPVEAPPAHEEHREPEPAPAAAEAAPGPAESEAPAEAAEQQPEPEAEAEPAMVTPAEAESDLEEGEPEAEEPPLAGPEEAEEAPAPAEAAAAAPPTNKKWYVVKVQSGREESIKAAIERKVKIEGLEEFFGQIAIPVEEVVEKKKVKAKVKDKKTGEVETVYQEKNVTKKRKKFPGYIFAEVEFNDRILYLFRETGGVGDFVGATHHRAPTPMTEGEVQSMLTGIAQKGGPKGGKVKVKLDFEKGDKVKIRDGPFANMEGEVKSITEPKDATETPKVTVVVSIFGRPVDVDLDYWHVDKV